MRLVHPHPHIFFCPSPIKTFRTERARSRKNDEDGRDEKAEFIMPGSIPSRMKLRNILAAGTLLVALGGSGYLMSKERTIQYTNQAGERITYTENKFTLRPRATWFTMNQMIIESKQTTATLIDLQNKQGIYDHASREDRLELVEERNADGRITTVPDDSLVETVMKIFTERTPRRGLEEYNEIYRREREIIKARNTHLEQ